MTRRLSANALGLTVVLVIAACGSASKDSKSSPRPTTGLSPARTTTSIPAAFPAQAARVCAAVAPRLKTTVQEVNTVNAQSGNPLAKLPKLARLLRQISAEIGTLREGLAELTPPVGQGAAFARFLKDLGVLRTLSATMATDLRSGTIAGLDRYRPLAARFSARGAALEIHRMKVPALSACRNIGR
ncbi:MAG TPA: hypothetical protein VGY97_00885 [Solirubrobacteraceae bacterium]|nr:hypothetical protein [Solirubrobacteraceae bacterium]